jgi:AbrB family looped-hinge helix DNA binding protein
LRHMCHNWEMETNERLKVRVGPQGRIVIPAALREELGVGPGQELVARVEDGRLILERREDVVRRLKGRFVHVPSDRVLSEELIGERREEARLEAEREAEFKNQRRPDGEPG